MKSIITKDKIGIGIIFFINFLFYVKYLSRATNYYLFFSVLLSCLCIVLWLKKDFVNTLFKKFKNLDFLIFSLFILTSSYIFIKIPAVNLNVDRWSVITSFWDTYFDGKYAYYATSHMNNHPGPMPFYFILALPFYFIGELGYFSLLGILIFILFARKKNNYGFLFLLICISPFYLWEVVCRSNIFLNSMLMVICIHFLLMIKNKKKLYVLMIFIMIGLVLSIRNVFVIPLGISLIYLTRTKKINIKVLTQFTFISLATFVLTFIPFIYDHLEDFLKVNPFIIQSDGLMPITWSLFFVATSCLTSYLCKNNLDVFFFIGLSLFITIIGHYIYHTIEDGYKEAFFNSKADISYFIFCVPFLAFTYSNSKINLSNLKHNQVVK